MFFKFLISCLACLSVSIVESKLFQGVSQYKFKNIIYNIELLLDSNTRKITIIVECPPDKDKHWCAIGFIEPSKENQFLRMNNTYAIIADKGASYREERLASRGLLPKNAGIIDPKDSSLKVVADFSVGQKRIITYSRDISSPENDDDDETNKIFEFFNGPKSYAVRFATGKVVKFDNDFMMLGHGPDDRGINTVSIKAFACMKGLFICEVEGVVLCLHLPNCGVPPTTSSGPTTSPTPLSTILLKATEKKQSSKDLIAEQNFDGTTTTSVPIQLTTLKTTATKTAKPKVKNLSSGETPTQKPIVIPAPIPIPTARPPFHIPAPIPSPTKLPTRKPTRIITRNPTTTKHPSYNPTTTKKPTNPRMPTPRPTYRKWWTKSPSAKPTKRPTVKPTAHPTMAWTTTKKPTRVPTKSPTTTAKPTRVWWVKPTASPTKAPSSRAWWVGPTRKTTTTKVKTTKKPAHPCLERKVPVQWDCGYKRCEDVKKTEYLVELVDVNQDYKTKISVFTYRLNVHPHPRGLCSARDGKSKRARLFFLQLGSCCSLTPHEIEKKTRNVVFKGDDDGKPRLIAYHNGWVFEANVEPGKVLTVQIVVDGIVIYNFGNYLISSEDHRCVAEKEHVPDLCGLMPKFVKYGMVSGYSVVKVVDGMRKKKVVAPVNVCEKLEKSLGMKFKCVVSGNDQMRGNGTVVERRLVEENDEKVKFRITFENVNDYLLFKLKIDQKEKSDHLKALKNDVETLLNKNKEHYLFNVTDLGFSF